MTAEDLSGLPGGSPIDILTRYWIYLKLLSIFKMFLLKEQTIQRTLKVHCRYFWHVAALPERENSFLCEGTNHHQSSLPRHMNTKANSGEWQTRGKKRPLMNSPLFLSPLRLNIFNAMSRITSDEGSLHLGGRTLGSAHLSWFFPLSRVWLITADRWMVVRSAADARFQWYEEKTRENGASSLSFLCTHTHTLTMKPFLAFGCWQLLTHESLSCLR